MIVQPTQREIERVRRASTACVSGLSSEALRQQCEAMQAAYRGGPIGIGIGIPGCSSGPGATGFLPTALSGLVLWLRADLGITTVDAAVSQPNDVSNAAWTKSGSTTPDAQTIRDTIGGGAPAEHYILQAITNWQANHTATLTAGVKAGTLGWTRFILGGAHAAFVNLTTGAVGTLTGAPTVTVVDAGSGWWRVSLKAVPTSANVFIETATADGANSYVGTDTGTILARSISATQQNVSVWADQSPAANHASQAVGGSYPLLVTTGIGGRQAVEFVAAGTPDWMATAGFALNQPSTSFVAGYMTDTTINQYFLDAATIANTRVMRGNAANQLNLYAGVQFNDGAIVSNAPAVLTGVYNGAGSIAGVNGVRTTADAGALNANGVTIGAAGAASGTQPLTGRVAEVIVFNRALTTLELQTVERYMGSRYGIGVA